MKTNRTKPKIKPTGSVLGSLLKQKDPFQAVESVIAKYFPTVTSEEQFERLPKILKTACRVSAFYLNGQVAGLIGLFSDTTTRLDLAEIESSLSEIGAFKSLTFIRRLRNTLPKKRFPTNAREANKVVSSLLKAQMSKAGDYADYRKRMSEYTAAVSELPEELRRYMLRNHDDLLDSLVASK
jgi:hypothetical protein